MRFLYWHVAIVTPLVAVGLLAGCDLSRPEPPRPESRPLVMGAFDRPAMINPVLSNFGISAVLVDVVFDGLVRVDENMEVQPGLAESWEVSEDGRAWTFHLRRGVTFHDGGPLTAEDVRYTFEVIGDPKYVNPYSYILDSIQQVTVVDDRTVRLVLRHPLPGLPSCLYAPILPKRLYEGEDLRTTRLNQSPVGTGPYRLARWSERELVFEANEAYFLGTPKIGTIVVKVFESPRASWAGLMRGQVDFVFFMGPETLEVVKKLPHLRVYETLHPYYNMLVLNHRNPLFRDRSVRQALNYALDKGRLVEEVLSGLGVAVSGLTLPGSSFAPREDLSYHYDPTKAAGLLAQSGWKDVDDDGVLERDGKEFRFVIYVAAEGFYHEKAALLIERQLAEVGVRARMRAVPLNDLAERYIRPKNFEAVLWSFTVLADPGLNYLFWSSTQIERGLNFSSYRNPRADRLVEQGRHALNEHDRMEAYLAFQREIFRDPPGIFLYWRRQHYVFPSVVNGVRIGPGGVFLSMYLWSFGPSQGAP